MDNKKIVSSSKNDKHIILMMVVFTTLIGLINIEVWYYTNHHFNTTNNIKESNNINNIDNKDDPYLAFNRSEAYLTIGSETSIYNYLQYLNINAEEITFTSNNNLVVKLINNSNIKALKEGMATITASYQNQIIAQININVSDKIYTANINIKDNIYYLYVGETLNVEYEYFPVEANTMDLEWSSSNNNIVTVNDGKITGMKVGSASITLKDNNSICNEENKCSDTSKATIYVVNYKIDYAIKNNNEYVPIKFLSDKTSINYNGSYTRTYDLKVKLVGKENNDYPNDISTRVNNINGSKTTLSYIGIDNTCDNCYLYKLTYTFDDIKADVENYSDIVLTLSDGSVSNLKVYTEEAYGCYRVCKPVLYLYPSKTIPITVSLAHPEYIMTSYPKYNYNWNVLANPNGNLYYKGKNYYALYWDEKYYVKKENIIDFKTGFYVNKENASEFLEEKLRIIGLNEREANEFIIYWLPILENNEHNLVYFELTNERELNNKININPKPDSLLRVIIHAKKIDKEENIIPEKLETFKRSGFTAVEWGGVQH